MTDKSKSFGERMRNSITIKLISIGILILILLIPVDMVEDLIREREFRQSDAINEVSEKWGKRQTIKGLILTIPYFNYVKIYDNEDDSKFRLVRNIEYAHFLPENLSIESTIQPEKRYRGIYEVVVYNCTVKMNGHFPMMDFSEWDIPLENIQWQDAFVSLELSDLRSIQENINVKWLSDSYSFNPGVETKDVIEQGVSVKVPVMQNDTLFSEYKFELDIKFNGSSGLYFIPLGKETNVSVKSAWKHPKFTGTFLPDSRNLTEEGFDANWNILHLNRPYPQSFRGEVRGINESEFGVELFMPVDEYRKSMRSSKYAVLFITLTFLTFFFIQVLNHIRIHPIQYIIVGLALCVFYTLLIAISEHLTFKWAYLISAVSIISMVTLYSKTIFKHKRLHQLLGLMLIILYGFIYNIIQLHDYALLMGSIGLFIILALIMFLSRKIDWYNIHLDEK